MARCWTRDCKNQARTGRRYCNSCRSRKHRERYPLKYIYDTIKGNARRRGKIFTLTYKQFEGFCRETGYDKFKGRHADDLSIDRKIPSLGYTADNIQAITLSQNTKKYFEEELPIKPIDSVPF